MCHSKQRFQQANSMGTATLPDRTARRRRERQISMWNVNKDWGPFLPNERLLWAASRGEEAVLREAIHAGAETAWQI